MSRSRSNSLGFGTDDVITSAEAVLVEEEPSVRPSVVWSALCCNAGRGSLSWTGLAIVCSSMTIGSLGVHLLLDRLSDKLDTLGHRWHTTLGTLAVFGILLAVPLTHGIVGVRKYGAHLYRFFQPFVGGVTFVFLQVIAWSLWSLTLLGGLYALVVSGKKLTSGWLSAVGVGGVVSQVLVLISLHFFVANVSTSQREKQAALKQRLKLRFTPSTSPASSPTGKRAPTPISTPASSTLDASRLAKHADAARTSMWPFSSRAMKVTFLIIATLSMLLAVFIESVGPVSPSTSVSLQSLLTSAILLAVPITHLLARRSLTNAGYLLFQPFAGGSKFVLLQAIAWTLWTLAFVSASATFLIFAMKSPGTTALAREVVDIQMLDVSWVPWKWLSNLITSAGVGGILSQALVLLSLKYFDKQLARKIGTTARVLEMVRASRESSTGTSGTPGSGEAPALSEIELEREVLQRAVRVLASPAVHGRRLWTPTGSPTSRTSDGRVSPIDSHGGGTPSSTTSRKTPSPFDIADLSDVPTLRMPSPSERSALAKKILADDAEAAAEAEAEAARADGAEEITPDEAEPTSPEPPFTLMRITLRDLSQSLHLAYHYYTSPEFFKDLHSLVMITMFYMIPIVGAIGTFAPWVLMYLHYPSLPWYFYTTYFSCLIFYLSTYRNRPSLTGSRNWPAMRSNRLLWDSLQRYFSGQVVALGKLSEADGPYIFGFHPHGVYPVTCFWASRSSAFLEHYPDLHIDICGASIMFQAPLLRDVIMWCGAREVSGKAIRHALKEKRSVMLIPGGQREMRHSRAEPDTLTLVTRHRGFIRMALEHGTPLVPVLSLGETMLLENVRAPRMQAYTLRTLGVGFPIWPYGRWYSPLPNPHPVVVIYGQPIPVPLNKDPPQALIEEIHAAYYAQLKEMFLHHRHMIDGMENCQLVYTED